MQAHAGSVRSCGISNAHCRALSVKVTNLKSLKSHVLLTMLVHSCRRCCWLPPVFGGQVCWGMGNEIVSQRGRSWWFWVGKHPSPPGPPQKNRVGCSHGYQAGEHRADLIENRAVSEKRLPGWYAEATEHSRRQRRASAGRKKSHSEQQSLQKPLSLCQGRGTKTPRHLWGEWTSGETLYTSVDAQSLKTEDSQIRSQAEEGCWVLGDLWGPGSGFDAMGTSCESVAFGSWAVDALPTPL